MNVLGTTTSAAPRPEFGLRGRVAWVTGASRGLGRALAFAFADAGAELLLTARSERAVGELAEQITAAGGVAHAVVGAVDEAADVERAVEAISSRWGRLDVLVNNAGISPSFSRSEQVDVAEFARVLDVNLTGAFACSAAAFPLMQAAGGGSIVNVSSVHGQAGHQRLAAYSASKGGLEALTRTLAVEWAARSIRVNAIAPGYLETDMTEGLRNHDVWNERLRRHIPLDRFGTVDEIASAVLFLASPAASYVTGATLAADGGWRAQ